MRARVAFIRDPGCLGETGNQTTRWVTSRGKSFLRRTFRRVAFISDVTPESVLLQAASTPVVVMAGGLPRGQSEPVWPLPRVRFASIISHRPDNNWELTRIGIGIPPRESKTSPAPSSADCSSGRRIALQPNTAAATESIRPLACRSGKVLLRIADPVGSPCKEL